MTGKGKHFRRQPHEFDAVFIVPPQHLRDISNVSEAQLFYIALASLYGCRLRLVGSIFNGMFGLRGIFERMTMFENGCYAACSRSEDWWIAGTEISV